jgi:hypothetical protein
MAHRANARENRLRLRVRIVLVAEDFDCNHVGTLLCFIHPIQIAILLRERMGVVLSRTWLRLVVGAVLALLSCLAAPAPVRASCGDYVMLGHTPPHAPIPAHPGAPTPDASTAAPKPSEQPCSGPSCSQHRLPLTPPPSSTSRWIEDRFSPSDAGVCLPVSPSDLLRPMAALPYQLLLVSSIYHPPR